LKRSTLSITAVERETGLSKETLRVWERRYGFPAPVRDRLGERAYSIPQIEKLRVVKRLMDAGHRPGKLVPLSVDDLHRLGEHEADTPRSVDDPSAGAELQSLLASLRAHDLGQLRGRLRQAVVQLGLSAFVIEVMAPLNALVGEAWMRGQLEIFQEHSYTETAQAVLRAGIHSLPEPLSQQRPRVLLSTLTGEPHGLGLLMAEALIAAEGAQCFPLGTQTPVWDIVLAAQAYRADLVALSFTGCMNPNKVVEALVELRAKLAPSMEVWVGGSAPVLHRRPEPTVATRMSLSELPDALRQWRAAHP
jgi:methanogenic corrinoid protein MtbC1